MRKSQQLLVSLSEARSRLNKMQTAETPPEEAEVRAVSDELLKLEQEYRTAVADEAAGEALASAHAGGEGAEIRSLLDRTRVSRYVRAALTDERIDGVEAELNAARGVPDSGIVQMPLELLNSRAAAPGRIEDRVDAVTAPAADFGGLNTGPTWLSRLFRPTLASYLGVTMDSPGIGDPEYLVLSSSNDPVMRARSEAVDAVAATLASVTMTPKRMSARYVWRVEDTGRIERLEEQLRSDLEMAVQVGMDTKVMQGDTGATGTDSDITGLTAATGVKEVTGTFRASIADGAALWTQATTALNGLVDGVRAQTPGEVALVLAPTLFRALYSLFPVAQASDTLADLLMRLGYSWRVAGNLTTAALAANDMVGLGSLPVGRQNAAIAAVWPTMSLIRDVYTGAAKGEVALTSIMLWDFKVVRADQFYRLKTS